MQSKSAQPNGKFTELRQETEGGARFLVTQLRSEYSLDVREALSPLLGSAILWKDSLWLSTSWRDKKWRFEANAGGVSITLYVYDTTNGITIRSMDLSKEEYGVEKATRNAIYEMTGIMEQLTIPRFLVDALERIGGLLNRLISRPAETLPDSRATAEDKVMRTAGNPKAIIQKK